MSDEETIPEGPSRGESGSPASGCCIFGAIIAVFGGLVILYTVVGIYQNRTIGGFTQDTAAEIAVIVPTPAQIAAVNSKLGLIETAVKENSAERVLFTVDDLNVLIATLDAAKDFRGNTTIQRIGPQGLVAAMAQPMRKGIFDNGVRYLNATFVLEPEVRARTIAFKVRDIRPAIGSVPQGFIDNYSVIDFFKLNPENPAIKAHIESLGAIYGEDGHLVVETKMREVRQ